MPRIERSIVDSGCILLKYWLEVSEAEQSRRLRDRVNDGRKTWKLSRMDLQSYSRWYDYSLSVKAHLENNGEGPLGPEDEVSRGELFVVREDDQGTTPE